MDYNKYSLPKSLQKLIDLQNISLLVGLSTIPDISRNIFNWDTFFPNNQIYYYLFA